MILFADLLIIVGLFGFIECTFGNLGLAWLFSTPSLRKKKLKRGMLPREELKDCPLRLDFLVVAHNEEKTIPQTLSSLAHARELFILKNHLPTGEQPQIRIHVGVDHCTDQTEAVVRKWSKQEKTPIKIIHNPGIRGKWNILQYLIHHSQSDWVVLVDVGSVWSPGLLMAAEPYLFDSEVMGIAPSYRPVKSGILESLHWRFERFMKTAESKLGGPVSVHGATVMYRRQPLMSVLEELNQTLSEEAWLNDDVVIPLMLRSRWPKFRIKYLAKAGDEAWVQDHGLNPDAAVREYGRRKRMLLGNLQWIQKIYGKVLLADLKVGLLASRRVFRTFWAYWAVLLLGGVALKGWITLHPSFWMVGMVALGVCIPLLMPLRGGLARLRAAFFACLEAPYYILNLKTEGVTWGR